MILLKIAVLVCVCVCVHVHACMHAYACWSLADWSEGLANHIKQLLACVSYTWFDCKAVSLWQSLYDISVTLCCNLCSSGVHWQGSHAMSCFVYISHLQYLVDGFESHLNDLRTSLPRQAAIDMNSVLGSLNFFLPGVKEEKSQGKTRRRFRTSSRGAAASSASGLSAPTLRVHKVTTESDWNIFYSTILCSRVVLLNFIPLTIIGFNSYAFSFTINMLCVITFFENLTAWVHLSALNQSKYSGSDPSIYVYHILQQLSGRAWIFIAAET